MGMEIAMDREKRVYDRVTQMLPSPEDPSPMVRINSMAPSPAFELFAKLEWMNPLGSVKDRAAAALLAQLESDGAVGPGRERSIIEATSGNTGLSLAALASVKGYRVRAVVPEKVPHEKRVALRLAGAELEVIDRDAPSNPIEVAMGREGAEPDRYAMPNQYENAANLRAHVETTGPEIWRQTDGRVTHFFAALGTAGTTMGVSTYLKSQNPGVKVVVVVPSEGHDVPGLRTLDELAERNLFDESLVDEIVEVDHDLAFERAIELVRREGLRAGPSCGLIYEGARRVIERDFPAGGAERGVGVAIFCDDFFKYIDHFLRHDPGLADTVASDGGVLAGG